MKKILHKVPFRAFGALVRAKAIVLSMICVIAMAAVVIPAQPVVAAGEALSLSEIQNKDGVYIKRGDKFYKIGDFGVSELDYNSWRLHSTQKRIICVSKDKYENPLTLNDGDQVVYVGSRPTIYGVSYAGYMVGRRAFELGGRKLYEASFYINISPNDFRSDKYTYINDIEIDKYLSRYNGGLGGDNAIVISNDFPLKPNLEKILLAFGGDEYILIADKGLGQAFTLGRWEGTKWVEKKLTVDTVYGYAYTIDSFIETTKNGYFVLNFDRYPGDTIYFKGSGAEGIVCVPPTPYSLEMSAMAPKYYPQVGDKLDDVLYTDIKAYINGAVIPSYNIGGSLYVLTADLRNYGFDAQYYNDMRCVMIDFVKDKAFTPIKVDANTGKVGAKMGDVLYTDIRAYIAYDGKEITSCNVNGSTAIPFSELRAFGNVNYDDATRSSTLVIK